MLGLKLNHVSKRGPRWLQTALWAPDGREESPHVVIWKRIHCTDTLTNWKIRICTRNEEIAIHEVYAESFRAPFQYKDNFSDTEISIINMRLLGVHLIFIMGFSILKSLYWESLLWCVAKTTIGLIKPKPQLPCGNRYNAYIHKHVIPPASGWNKMDSMIKVARKSSDNFEVNYSVSSTVDRRHNSLR